MLSNMTQDCCNGAASVQHTRRVPLVHPTTLLRRKTRDPEVHRGVQARVASGCVWALEDLVLFGAKVTLARNNLEPVVLRWRSRAHRDAERRVGPFACGVASESTAS